ncbi:helix-turn-helix domain-containing protein [Clostridium butyricum]|uniref:helix-turn-helix domain-containing protein n=1 Tax=Clostridium butyricum TaxID=1492 RepID=UPI00346635C0|nr:helix-turn-helix transcriptional regulator [Clostridium butyricum]
MISLPDRLKQLRKSNNLTQTELGKILGVGKTTISMYETNNSTPNDEIKLKIAEYFNVSLDYLLGKTDIRNYTDDNNATIALHSDTDYDDLPEEARKEINNFIEFVKQKYKDKK